MFVSDFMRFQFPSNGKAYPKPSVSVPSALRGSNGLPVSIPFKRESISKVMHYCNQATPIIQPVSIPFKRESISKVRCSILPPKTIKTVSIPFKRESISKVGRPEFHVETLFIVSIPFKRESISKGIGEILGWVCRFRVSIPFKRESISKDIVYNNRARRCIMFQFPSNGKAYPKRRNANAHKRPIL